MAGFIFSVVKDDGFEGVARCVKDGDYAALVPEKLDNSTAKQVTASVLADYCSMKEGDNVYFLSNRCIYGVGKLVNIGSDCKYKNYLRAHLLETIDKLDVRDYPIKGKNPKSRWICFFQPNDKFFKQGVDMDEILTYKPGSFRMLRAFQDRSFIKIDDEENQALKECIYLKNKDNKEFMGYLPDEHNRIAKMDLEKYLINVGETVKNEYSSTSEEVNLEMLLEAYLVNQIQTEGFYDDKYDYITHQVIASPFKPIAYIDKMDIFGYKYLQNFPGEMKPVEKYLIIELKKGKANAETLLQVMRYVDWVTQEYASGNYSLIKAAIIAKDYVKGLDKILREQCVRSYISNTHPNKTSNWSSLDLLTYSVNNVGNIEISKYNAFDAINYLKEMIVPFGMELINGGITIEGVKYKSRYKIKNKKIAIFEELKDEEKEILEKNRWKLFFLSQLKNKDDILKIVNSLVE